MTNTTIEKSMMLISSGWRGFKTFKMIPVNKDCPYNECIFDPAAKNLAVVSREKKENYHMVPKISDSGDVVPVKQNKRPGGQTYQEQRVLIDTYYEYYMEEQREIEEFIRMFAVNADTFDFMPILEESFKVEEEVTV